MLVEGCDTREGCIYPTIVRLTKGSSYERLNNRHRGFFGVGPKVHKHLV